MRVRFNIQIGDNFCANSDCAMLDGGGIEIGNDVLSGRHPPSNHAIDSAERALGGCYAKPVRIGNRVWVGIGAGVHINQVGYDRRWRRHRLWKRGDRATSWLQVCRAKSPVQSPSKTEPATNPGETAPRRAVRSNLRVRRILRPVLLSASRMGVFDLTIW